MPLAIAHAQTLEEAWTQAYRNNPSLEAQRAEWRAVDEQVSQALSNWRPTVDATGSAGRTEQYAPELAPFEDPRFTGTARSYGIEAKEPLFRGVRTKAGTESRREAGACGPGKA
jgi:outer membrane protein